MDEILPSDQDMAFMGAVDIVLRVIQQVVPESQRSESNPLSGQAIEDRVMKGVGTQEVFDALFVGAYGEGGLARFRRDCETILARFRSQYEREPLATLELMSFLVGEDQSPSARVRFVELLQAACVSASCGVDASPLDVQERKFYEFLRVLFLASEEGGKEPLG